MELEPGKTYRTASGTLATLDRKGRKYLIGTIKGSDRETQWWPDGTHRTSAGLKLVEQIDPDSMCVLKDITMLWKKEHNSFLRREK